ncbi:CNNM domain-containing protein [Leeia aquatica]|uniref:DUF21 domain-containing protein n=1 Tax=Leeia aquatica TaxID=2725557 RepID=A0A847SAY8_9NEIS|nr:CNNM domain-containing protein [Leeia aquatica]NLR76903.1 DUF21 domain-containing protein [Leeia aquatica]
MDDIPSYRLLWLTLGLLAGCGLLAAAEFSLLSVNRLLLRQHVQNKHWGARLALRLLQQPEQLLATLLLCRIALYLSLAGFATLWAVDHFTELALPAMLLTWACCLLAIVAVSELAPRLAALLPAPALAYACSYLLYVLRVICLPLSQGLQWSIRQLLRPLAHARPQDDHDALRLLLGESPHLFQAQHRTLLLNLLDLSSRTVDDIMTPRQHMERFDLSQPAGQGWHHLAMARHTLLPAYQGDDEQISGILHARKALSLRQRDDSPLATLQPLIRPPLFIPSGTPLLTQLREFQRQRQRMGLVVDEYGEIQGLLTLTDILGEVLGELPSEGRNQAGWQAAESGSVLADGACLLRDLQQQCGLPLPLDGPKTLNGLILQQLEGLPEVGTCLRLGEVIIEVISMQERGVKRARLSHRVSQASNT